MDSATLNRYRDIIEQTLSEYAAIPYARAEVKSELTFDRARDRYLIINQGWRDDERIHYCLAHLEIFNGKIWIQHDGTEEGIAGDLEREGVPKEHIVLGFYEPEVRQYTDYAAA